MARFHFCASFLLGCSGAPQLLFLSSNFFLFLFFCPLAGVRFKVLIGSGPSFTLVSPCFWAALVLHSSILSASARSHGPGGWPWKQAQGEHLL